MWDVVDNGNYIPLDFEVEPLARSSWSNEQKHKYLLNSKARNLLMCALYEEEYKKVHAFKGAKEMWDTLIVTHEALSEVKRNKLSLLTWEYKLFSMLDNENIQTMFSWFQTILNELRSLCKIYDNFDNIDKILLNLHRQWRPQVTALRTSKNLDGMSLEVLVEIL
ncbi:uncharacterized protein LOC108341401 [Vigna angularis]|uniref:uncharacterized protein LOC108341401 n=1 Tax=Phaseolus angularis TaxID=3914 RepID=UPI00080A0867|nr:uncharacterized protein LOC108341401 [Vigna angularis]